MPSYPVEVLWCARGSSSGKDGWAFPRKVRNLLVKECEGLTVIHFFGGKADFGLRLDIDESTNPDFVGDAWLPPFGKDAFDVVILDPPYIGEFKTLNNQKVIQLLGQAAYVARQRVIWFHPQWLECPAKMKMEKTWLVRVGRSCTVRALEFFTPPQNKRPITYFTRGSAIKYNRWIQQPERLPLDGEPDPVAARVARWAEASGYR